MKVTVDRDLDVCQTGAVEILGLQATVAPRRQQAQTPPTLEYFDFVPYTQSNINDNNKELQSYTQDILGLIRTSLENIFNNGMKDKVPNAEIFKKVLGELKNSTCNVDKYIKSGEKRTKPDSYALINMLHKMFSQEHNDQFFPNAVNIRKTYQDELKYDILLTSVFKPEVFKPCLDVVLENSKNMTKLKIVELYTGTEIPLYSKVIPLLNSQPMLSIDYSMAGLNLDSLDKAEMEGLDIKTVTYDFLTSSKSVPTLLNNADLIILNNILHKKEDIPGLLQELPILLKADGFLLITEPTSNHAISLVLEGINSDLSRFEDRSLGPFWTEQEIKKHLAANSLQVVQNVSDELLSSLYLCRWG